VPLATGVIDSVAAVRALHNLGYDGPVWVEPFEPAATRLQAMPLERALQTLYDSTNEVLTRAGAR
jgi:sugar phosphate isomerase/epimerase